MARKTKTGIGRAFEQFSSRVTRWTGGSAAFGLACTAIILWAVLGPVFGFSNTWQLVINTGTTIITFLMVFLIQRTQNKDSLAIQLKLNELVAAVEGASNRLIDVEDLSEDELRALHKYYGQLVQMAKQDVNLTLSHSVEEAHERHLRKLNLRKKKDAVTP
ncbi:MAG TPA: low affinity iron permease family protein [Vicinamibacterales bacterium]|nr:low affinity iron permease family protein [Vicinamibacterales bacterium]